MLKKSFKDIIMGNVQLMDYCKENDIKLNKLKSCNIEKMGDVYYFVLPKGMEQTSLDNDIDSQPDVVLTMDTSDDTFRFANTEWTPRVI
jgi:hypothetical protein